MWPRSYLCEHLCENPQTRCSAQQCGPWVLHCWEKCWNPKSHWRLWCRVGYIYYYIHTYSFTEPLSTQVGLNIQFIMKSAILQYENKSSTSLNDGKQCLGGVFSHRCKTVLPDSHSTQRPTLSRSACCNYTSASWNSYHLFPQLC